jgi:putative colanic acid biosynthesis acetyltransferase WcaF
MKVDLSRYDEQNLAYKQSIGASYLKQLLWFFCSSVFVRNPLIPFSGFRKMVLVLFGAKIGKAPRIRPGVIIKFPWKLVMGDHVWLGENCWIDNLAQVTIGSNSCISQGAFICTGNHNFTSPDFELIAKPVVISDGVWIGACSVVCPGVHAAQQAVLSAGSVVTTDMESNMVYQGNPAIIKRKRF